MQPNRVLLVMNIAQIITFTVNNDAAVSSVLCCVYMR